MDFWIANLTGLAGAYLLGSIPTALRTLTEDVLKSSEIEGEILDKAQVRSSIARRLGIDIGALTPADHHVEGIVEMMLDATQGFDQPLTDERLFGWHRPAGGAPKIVVNAKRNARRDTTLPITLPMLPNL